jgi:hypothetical protein
MIGVEFEDGFALFCGKVEPVVVFAPDGQLVAIGDVAGGEFLESALVFGEGGVVGVGGACGWRYGVKREEAHDWGGSKDEGGNRSGGHKERSGRGQLIEGFLFACSAVEPFVL